MFYNVANLQGAYSIINEILDISNVLRENFELQFHTNGKVRTHTSEQSTTSKTSKIHLFTVVRNLRNHIPFKLVDNLQHIS